MRWRKGLTPARLEVHASWKRLALKFFGFSGWLCSANFAERRISRRSSTCTFRHPPNPTLKSLQFSVWLRFVDFPASSFSRDSAVRLELNLEPASRVRSFCHDPLSQS
jgi:hypothetical protein